MPARKQLLRLTRFAAAFFVGASLLGGTAGWAKSKPMGLEEKIKNILIPHAEKLAALPAVIEAVKRANAAPSIPMTNAKWKLLPVNSDIVQSIQNNAASLQLQKAIAPYVAEVFVNAANGTKAAFMEKTTSWNHAGAAKHKMPMRGKIWVGELQLDDSSGSNQVQVSVPVKEGGKIVGSLVIGAAAAKL